MKIKDRRGYPSGFYRAENGKWVEILNKYNPDNENHLKIAPPESAFVALYMNPEVPEGKDFFDMLDIDPSIMGCGFTEDGKALFHPDYDRSSEKWDLVESYYDYKEGQRKILDEKLKLYKITCERNYLTDEGWLADAICMEKYIKVAQATADNPSEAVKDVLTLLSNYLIDLHKIDLDKEESY